MAQQQILSTQVFGGAGGAGGSSSATVTNDSGSDFPIGTPVYLDSSDSMSVSALTSFIDAANRPCLGVTSAAIADGASGSVLIQGDLAGIDTTGKFAGDFLYADSSGALTITAPATGNQHLIAYVKTVGVNGTIFVFPSDPSPPEHDHRSHGTGGLLVTSVFSEIAAASVTTPASGTQTVFIDTADHLLKIKNSSGVVRTIG